MLGFTTCVSVSMLGAVLIWGVAPGFSQARAALKGGATFNLGQLSMLESHGNSK